MQYADAYNIGYSHEELDIVVDMDTTDMDVDNIPFDE